MPRTTALAPSWALSTMRQVPPPPTKPTQVPAPTSSTRLFMVARNTTVALQLI